MNDRPSVLIASPMYQGCTAQFFMSAVKTLGMLNDTRVKHSVMVCDGIAMVTAARNELVRRFLETDFKSLLFVDADMVWQPRDLTRILSHDAALVAGCYFAKRYPLTPTAFVDREPVFPDGDKLKAVDYAGCGFMRIDRKIFELLKPTTQTFETIYGPAYKFFDTSIDPETGQDLSECFHFCGRVREAGEKVWLDQAVRLRHVGNFVYGA